MKPQQTSGSGPKAPVAAVITPSANASRVSNRSRDPSPFRRWLQSRFLSRRVKPENRAKLRREHDKKLLATTQPQVLKLFHTPGDPHSDLAVQALLPLCERYGLQPELHVVPPPNGAHNPEPELLPVMARQDANQIARWYGLSAEPPAKLPIPEVPGGPQKSAEHRKLLGHYGSGMFYLEGEWYWGVDRVCHLETRLQQLGLDRTPADPLLFPRPDETAIPDSGIGWTLEWYGSLRSPYTALGWPRIRAICNIAGLTLDLRPVLPMVMRGAPVSRPKGLYIFDDAAREAELYEQKFGPFYDPIGEPVRRAYRILPELREQGVEQAFFGEFLNAAFAEGVNTASQRGLRRILRRAGATPELYDLANSDRPLPEELEANQQAMYALPSWGVPTFRMLDEEGREVMHAFGQDRLWLISRALATRA